MPSGVYLWWRTLLLLQIGFAKICLVDYACACKYWQYIINHTNFGKIFLKQQQNSSPEIHSGWHFLNMYISMGYFNVHLPLQPREAKLMHALKKTKKGIIWEFFPTWGGGSSQFPKLKTKTMPLNHPKITQKTNQICHKITQKISFWTRRSQNVWEKFPNNPVFFFWTLP